MPDEKRPAKKMLPQNNADQKDVNKSKKLRAKKVLR